MTYYIQRRDGHNLETVDETESKKDASYLVLEYSIADPSGEYYVSSRACKDWKEKGE
jgi:hypothetical protein